MQHCFFLRSFDGQHSDVQCRPFGLPRPSPGQSFYTRSASESRGYNLGPSCRQEHLYNPLSFSLQTRSRQRTSLQAPNIVIRYDADSVMPQRLAADQHGSLVQLLPRFIFSASINLALITPPGATVYPVIGNLFDCPGMSLVDRRGILR